jgi:type IV pilus assembly protein PilQ
MRTRAVLSLALSLVAFANLGRSEVAEPAPTTPAPAAEAPTPDASVPAAAPAVTEPAPVAAPAPTETTPAVPVAADSAAAATPGVTKPQTAAGDGRLSVDFPDEDIRNILRNVADLFELNLIIPETLQGKATIKLRNVTWRQIFQKVLTPIVYGFIEDDYVVSVVTLDEVNEQQESIIIPITSGNLGEAKLVALAVVSRERDLGNGRKIAGGTVTELPAASALQITDTVPKLAAVRETLSRLSKANSATNTRQVLIETKFYDVTDGNTRNLGVAFKKLATIDGGQLNLFQGDQTQAGIPIGVPNPFSTAIYSRNSFLGAIDALQQDNRVKLVTNPMIVTQQNHKAEIFEKTTLRYFVPVPQAQGAVPSPPEIKEIEVKTGLTVTPSIIDTRDVNGDVTDSLIQMLVVPEVSSLGQNDVYTAAGASITIPRVNTRTTTTNVVLKNGYTLVLGGLVKTQINKTKTKTPILGDIPGLGLLFRQTLDNLEQRTLLTFITARIITPDGSQPDSEKNPLHPDFAEPAKKILTAKQIHDLDITKQEMPGYIDPAGVTIPDAVQPVPASTR